MTEIAGIKGLDLLSSRACGVHNDFDLRVRLADTCILESSNVVGR